MALRQIIYVAPWMLNAGHGAGVLIKALMVLGAVFVG